MFENIFKNEDKPIPEHVPTEEDKEVEALYLAFLKDGWAVVSGNQWVNDGKNGSHFLITMKKGNETKDFRSTIPLPMWPS